MNMQTHNKIGKLFSLIGKLIKEIKNNGFKSALRKLKNKFSISIADKQVIDWEQFNLNDNILSVCIVHVDPTQSIGGVQKYLLEDTNVLNKNNIDCMYIFPSTNKDNNRKFNININIKYEEKNLEFSDIKNILMQINKNKKDMIYSLHHCLNWKIDELNCFLNFDKDILVFFHDIFWLDYQYFDRKFAFMQALNSPNDIAIFFEKLIIRSSCLIFPSDFLAHKYSQSIFLPQEKIYIYPNQLMTKKRIDSKKIKIAYLGYKAQHKGWDLFEKLTKMKILHEHYDFLHIGAEDEYSHPSYKKIRANYNLKGKTTLDMLKKHEIDMVLLYSTMEESYSYTLYESIVAGIPVLTSTKSGNIYHMISEGLAYGRYFPNDEDVINFMAASENVIQWLQDNPHNHSMILEHNSFTLTYINNKGRYSC